MQEDVCISEASRHLHRVQLPQKPNSGLEPEVADREHQSLSVRAFTDDVETQVGPSINSSAHRLQRVL